MILTAFYVFWLSTLLVFYTYVGYGVVIYIFSKIKRPTPVPNSGIDLPDITLLIAAYNEEGFIEEKIRNTLALDYPTDKLHIMIVTDGSNDRTPELVAKNPSIQLFHEPERRGKIHAVNRVIKLVTTPIVIFCDANTYLNPESLKLMVRHYADPKVGGVAGEKRIFKKEEDSASGAGEGIYWKYESFLKRKDSEVYSIVGAAGELFSLRTALFEEPPADTIIEDFYISLRIAARGYRFVYEPGAYATESASASVEEEWKRKVRICAGGFQAMARLTPLLNPFRYGMLSFQYVSHRVLRWTLAPLALPLIFISNVILAIYAGPVYQAILVAQLGFYVLALLGYVMRDKPITIKGFFVPYYFAVMNFSVYAGFRRYLKGSQSVVWDKSKRAAVPGSKFKVQS
jgi:cellulose synthase/poly-beta-1,6-N-acetylglucosamine synthase-like glycosyltransferase